LGEEIRSKEVGFPTKLLQYKTSESLTSFHRAPMPKEAKGREQQRESDYQMVVHCLNSGIEPLLIKIASISPPSARTIELSKVRESRKQQDRILHPFPFQKNDYENSVRESERRQSKVPGISERSRGADDPSPNRMRFDLRFRRRESTKIGRSEK
jgi:hypothetical protein